MERGNLVISLRCGESVDIGDNITVRVLQQCGSQTKLSIEADKNIRILRENAICREPKKAV